MRTRRQNLVRPVAAMLATCQLTGCMGWRVETVPVPAVLDRKHPDEIRIRLKDGREYMLRDPVIVNDSIRGTVGAKSSQRERAEPLSDVADVATRHVAVVRSMFAAAGGVAAVAALLTWLLWVAIDASGGLGPLF